MKKKLYLVLALLVALAVTSSTFAVTQTTATATPTVTAGTFIDVTASSSKPSGFGVAPTNYGSVPSWQPLEGASGDITAGSIYWMDPGDYAGDIWVTIYLNNAVNLRSAYSYLNMAIIAHHTDNISSTTASDWSLCSGFGSDGNWTYYLTLTNGYVSFVLSADDGYHIGIADGAWYCIDN